MCLVHSLWHLPVSGRVTGGVVGLVVPPPTEHVESALFREPHQLTILPDTKRESGLKTPLN